MNFSKNAVTDSLAEYCTQDVWWACETPRMCRRTEEAKWGFGSQSQARLKTDPTFAVFHGGRVGRDHEHLLSTLEKQG